MAKMRIVEATTQLNEDTAGPPCIHVVVMFMTDANVEVARREFNFPVGTPMTAIRDQIVGEYEQLRGEVIVAAIGFEHTFE